MVLSASAIDRKREGAAAYRVVINAAIAIGPPVAGLLSGRHFGLLFVLDGLSSLVLATIVWRFVPGAVVPAEEHRPDVPGLRLWHALRAEPIVLGVLFSIMLVDTSYRQLFVTYPLELHRLGVPNVVYGLLVALNCVVIVLFEVPLAVRLTRRPVSLVISSGYLLVGLGWVVFGVHPIVITAVAAMLVTTVGEMLYKPNAMASVAAAAPAGFEGRFQSMYAGASVAGLVFGPAVGGWVYGVSRPAVWFGAAGLAVAGAGLLLSQKVTQITSVPGT